MTHIHHPYNVVLMPRTIKYTNYDCLVDIIRWLHQEKCISTIFYFLICCSVTSVRYIHQGKFIHLYVSTNIYTLQLMTVDCIVQQVQYKYFDCRHHVLPLSLACIIMVHGTQKHPLSNLAIIQFCF